MTDERISKLVAKAQAGDEDSIEELIFFIQPRVFRFLLSITRAPWIVEDLAQEILTLVFQKLKSFRGEADFLTWVYRISFNRSLDWLRKNKKFSLKSDLFEEQAFPYFLFVHSIDGERIVLDRERQKKIRVAIGELEPSDRVLLWLRYIEEFSPKEIAKILKISPSTVRSRLFYARLRLRERLREFFEDYSETDVKEE